MIDLVYAVSWLIQCQKAAKILNYQSTHAPFKIISVRRLWKPALTFIAIVSDLGAGSVSTMIYIHVLNKGADRLSTGPRVTEGNVT